MAFLCCCDSYLALAACSEVFVIKRDLQEPDSSTESIFSWPIILSTILPDEASSASKDGDQGDTNEEPDRKRMKNLDLNLSISTQILAAGFSTSGRVLAICNNRKRLVVWRENNGYWTMAKHWTLEKQATALAIPDTEKSILVADRYGQVTEYNMDDDASESRGVVLLGHLSILLDMCLSRSQRYLLTADRDEKIRVSHYPKCYDIQAFCLGHTEYVRTICVCPGLAPVDVQEGILVSGGGDGKIRLWRFVDGVELASIDCNDSSNGDGSHSKSFRKICVEEPSTSDQPGFRLIVSFEESTDLQLVDVSRNEIGDYVMQKSTNWTPDRSGHTIIADLAVIGNRLITLLTNQSILEFDLTSTTPVQLANSPATERLMKCEKFIKCMQESKAEFPPMLKDVQYDNMGDYLARKKARLEGKSKD